MFPDISTTVLMALSALIAVLLGILIWLRRSPLKIVCRDPLFEPEARSFLGQLDIAVRSHLNIFPSLPVADVLAASRFSRSSIALNKVAKLRFDYVLCHRREMEVLCVIKLLPYGKDSDSKELKALREVCEAADLTLLEYEMKPYRNVLELRKVVFSACGIDELEAREHGIIETRGVRGSVSSEQDLSEKDLPEKDLAEENQPATNASPPCPKCAASMKLTTLKKGPRAGQECWICSTYPECKGAKLVTTEQD